MGETRLEEITYEVTVTIAEDDPAPDPSDLEDAIVDKLRELGILCDRVDATRAQ